MKQYFLGILILTLYTCFAYSSEQNILITTDDLEPMKVLAQVYENHGYAVEIAGKTDVPSDLSGYYAVVNFIHTTMTEESIDAMIHYTNQGGRLILLHHAIASNRWKTPKFLEFAGIHLDPRDHPKTPWRVIANTTHTMVNLNPSHYITSNNIEYEQKISYQSSNSLHPKREFPIIKFENTEIFLNQQFTDGYEKTVLFGFHCIDPETGKPVMQDRSGWLKPSADGWIFYFQPGHIKEDFQHPQYQQILLNCLTWQPCESNQSSTIH